VQVRASLSLHLTDIYPRIHVRRNCERAYTLAFSSSFNRLVCPVRFGALCVWPASNLEFCIALDETISESVALAMTICVKMNETSSVLLSWVNRHQISYFRMVVGGLGCHRLEVFTQITITAWPQTPSPSWCLLYVSGSAYIKPKPNSC
jgi:uncharacterized membrane protein